MPRDDLGSRTLTGVSDLNKNLNPYLPGSGWDVLFTPDVIASNLTDFEVYHIALDGPVGSSATWQRDGKTIGWMAGWLNEWDAVMSLDQTSELQFFWNVAFAAGPYNKTSNIQPSVTIWLRRRQQVIY